MLLNLTKSSLSGLASFLFLKLLQYLFLRSFEFCHLTSLVLRVSASLLSSRLRRCAGDPALSGHSASGKILIRFLRRLSSAGDDNLRRGQVPICGPMAACEDYLTRYKEKPWVLESTAAFHWKHKTPTSTKIHFSCSTANKKYIPTQILAAYGALSPPLL